MQNNIGVENKGKCVTLIFFVIVIKTKKQDS